MQLVCVCVVEFPRGSESVCPCAYMCVCAHVCVHGWTCVCTCAHMCVCVCAWVHVSCLPLGAEGAAQLLLEVIKTFATGPKQNATDLRRTDGRTGVRTKLRLRLGALYVSAGRMRPPRPAATFGEVPITPGGLRGGSVGRAGRSRPLAKVAVRRFAAPAAICTCESCSVLTLPLLFGVAGAPRIQHLALLPKPTAGSPRTPPRSLIPCVDPQTIADIHKQTNPERGLRAERGGDGGGEGGGEGGGLCALLF